MSAVAKVIVEVLKIPENSKHVPEIQNPNQKVDITESDTVGFTVALINAVDKDQDYLWYRIESKYLRYYLNSNFILLVIFIPEVKSFCISLTVFSSVRFNNISDNASPWFRPVLTSNDSDILFSYLILGFTRIVLFFITHR